MNQKLINAIKNPPPERLAAIEYRSHFLQCIGITVVCILLIAKGFWYIIFAFIFGVGISYSQGITAYKKYQMIMSLQHPEQAREFEKEKSPTRRRSKIITYVMGSSAKWMTITISVVLSMMIIQARFSRWILMLIYPLTIILCYILIYFFILYWICYPIYKRRINLKGEKLK